MLFLHFLYFSLCPLKDWRKFVIRIECTDQLCVMPATVHLRVSVMTQRQTVRSTYSYCIAAPTGHSLANLLFIHPFIYLLLDFIHPHAPASLLPLPFSLLTQHRLRLLCWLKCLLYGISLSIAEVLSLTTSDCFRLGPGDQDLSRPREGRQASIIVLHVHFLVGSGWGGGVSNPS